MTQLLLRSGLFVADPAVTKQKNSRENSPSAPDVCDTKYHIGVTFMTYH